jgi:SAM-dependent methyltransferase
MEVQTGNPHLRALKRVFRKKVKLMAPATADDWLARLARLYEERYGVTFHPLQTDPAIVPSKTVVDQVQGPSKADPVTFRGTGAMNAHQYLTELDELGFDMSGAGRMLDFGFGTGRVLVHFLPFALERHGCDVNPASLDWTRRTLGDYAQLCLSQLEPPLPYPDDHFDLIIATSVFTHTPLALQPAWIAEFRRILKPGGYAAVTVHDPDKVPARSRERGWHETGKARGIHMRALLTEAKLQELWGASLECLAVRRYPGQQAHVISRKAPD